MQRDSIENPVCNRVG